MRRTEQQIADILKHTLRAFPPPARGKPGKPLSSAHVVDAVTTKHPTIKPQWVKDAIKQLVDDGALVREGVARASTYHRPLPS